MGILDDIANGYGRTASPVTAFLVGRQQKQAREAQLLEQQLAQRSADRSDRSLDIQQAQIDQRQAEATQKDEAEARQLREVRAAARQVVAQSEFLTPQEKAQRLRMIDANEIDMVFTDILRRGAPQTTEDGGFTLADGAIRFDASGRMIAENPKEPTARAPTADDRKRQMYLAQGATEREADLLISGLAELKFSDQNNTMAVVDNLGVLRGDPNAVREIPIQPAQRNTEAPPVQTGQTLWALSPEATGPRQTLEAAGSYGSALAGGPIAEKTIEARQIFSAAQQTLIRAFANNPRYPVGEMDRIREEMSVQPGAFKDVSVLRAQMRGLDQELQQKQQELEFYLKQPGVPKDQRDADNVTLREVKAFRSRLGVPVISKDEDERLKSLGY